MKVQKDLQIDGKLSIGGVPPSLASLQVEGGDIYMTGGLGLYASGDSGARTLLYRGGSDFTILRNYSQQYTILQLWPFNSNLGNEREATIALVRGDNAETNMEYLDLYNNGYASETQFGIRIQKRGTGQYRDFVFDQYDGTTKTPLMVLKADGNIGIGTLIPTEKLHVDGNTYVNGNITIPNSSAIKSSGGELVLEQNGEMFGTTRLRLQNRVGANGAVFEQAGSVDLVDFIFKSLTQQRNIRFEARTANDFLGAPEFQIGQADNPTLVVADSGVLIRRGNLQVTNSISEGGQLLSAKYASSSHTHTQLINLPIIISGSISFSSTILPSILAPEAMIIKEVRAMVGSGGLQITIDASSGPITAFTAGTTWTTVTPNVSINQYDEIMITIDGVATDLSLNIFAQVTV